MRSLYTLTFRDDIGEGFFIGVFASRSEAEYTAERYKNCVTGFRDYPCEYEIKEKKVIGAVSEPERVSMIRGWNLDDDMDETDLWESDLYADADQARAALAFTQKEMTRHEWCVSTYRIGECEWQEGFVRIN